MDWTRGLDLWPVIRFIGTKTRAVLRLRWSRHLTRSSAGLSGTIDLARAAARIGTCNSGLRSDGSRSCDQSGAAFVHIVKLLAVLRGFALVLDLRRHRRSAGSAEGCDLCRPRPDVNAAATAIIRNARPVVDHHGAVVDVSNVDDVNAVDRAVVVEVVAVPVAAIVAITGVTEAVVDAAIESDVQTPVTAEEAPAVVVPAPVSGSPERAVVRRSTPCPRNPVITGRSPTPVSGGPDIVWRRGFGLLILRQFWRWLIRIFDGLSLALGVELLIGLSVLVGLIRVGRRWWCDLLGLLLSV